MFLDFVLTELYPFTRFFKEAVSQKADFIDGGYVVRRGERDSRRPAIKLDVIFLDNGSIVICVIHNNLLIFCYGF